MKKFVSILLILVLVFAMTTVAFAAGATSPEKQNTNVDTDDSQASPQTGETNAVVWVISALVVAIGALLFCGKKLVCNK